MPVPRSLTLRSLHLLVFGLLGGSLPIAAATAQSCAKGRSEATLGIVVQCVDCQSRKTAEGTAYTLYRNAPAVVSLDQAARMTIRLKKGDIIMAVDGEDIRTEEGARRFSAPSGDRPVRLSVRRGGSDLAVTVQPIKPCVPRD